MRLDPDYRTVTLWWRHQLNPGYILVQDYDSFPGYRQLTNGAKNTTFPFQPSTATTSYYKLVYKRSTFLVPAYIGTVIHVG